MFEAGYRNETVAGLRHAVPLSLGDCVQLPVYTTLDALARGEHATGRG